MELIYKRYNYTSLVVIEMDPHIQWNLQIAKMGYIVSLTGAGALISVLIRRFYTVWETSSGLSLWCAGQPYLGCSGQLLFFKLFSHKASIEEPQSQLQIPSTTTGKKFSTSQKPEVSSVKSLKCQSLMGL